MAEEAEIARKASILSVLSENYEEKRKSLPSKRGFEKEPEDSFFLVHICCLFLGFLNIMPLLFFNTAAGYWMYKFRDPSITSDTTTGSERTTLQSYYQSCSIIAQMLPSVFVSTLLTIYGHKISAMLRTIWSLILMVVLFVIFTIFTQINTDNWRTEFFSMTIFLLIINSGLASNFQMSTAVIIAKFPHEYMYYFLLGQNGTFITTSLQIISLLVTDYQPISGLIYFCSGTLLITITLGLLLVSRYSKIFKYYDVEDVNDTKSETVTWQESKELIKKIWPCQVLVFILIANVAAVHPSITTLVVSEQEADKSVWTTKLFTPVTVFLIAEFGSLAGRICSKVAVVTSSNKWWYIGFCAIRLFISIPFFMLCDAEPRNLPVVFNKDWEFIIFNLFFGFSMGFMMNVCFMSIKGLAENKQEAALKLLTLTFAIAAASMTANGLLMVKALTL